jgi:predicted nucleic acid-binding protein
MSDAPAVPVVLDTSVITEVARGDSDIITFIQRYDARGQAMVIPAMAIAAASLDSRGEESADLLGGLELLDNATIAPLRGTEQAIRLADIIARTELDPWDAHVAAVADASICPILTLNAAKWRQPSADLDQPLHVIEIADPDDPGRGTGGLFGGRSGGDVGAGDLGGIAEIGEDLLAQDVLLYLSG